MFDGDGADTVELQAWRVAQNQMTGKYRGSAPCPNCGIILDPVAALHSYKGLCQQCTEHRMAARVKNKLA